MKPLLLLLLSACLLSPATAHAQARPYLGGSIGASFYNTSVEDVTGDDFELDGEEFAWKIFGGVRAERFLAVEGGYRQFGKINNTVAGVGVESKTNGWDLYAAGNLPIGLLDVFGKAGILWWRAESRIEEHPFDVNGHDFAWGLGAAIHLGGLGVRAEFERVELEGDDSIMMLTAGVTIGM